MSNITPHYRIVGPESDSFPIGSTHTFVFRPETNIPPNSKLILSGFPAGLGQCYVTSIKVDQADLLSGSGRVPIEFFSATSENNDIRLPAFSAIKPLRVTVVASTAAAAVTPVGAAVIPPDRMDVGVQTAAARGRQIVAAAQGRGRPAARRLRGFDVPDDVAVGLGHLNDHELMGLAQQYGVDALGELPADVAVGLGFIPDPEY